MNIFDIIKNIYTNPKSNWIKDLEDSEIQPFVIQRFLVMNDNLRVFVRWLDPYVFNLPPKMYLSLAWSVVPKASKQPFVKYIKQKEVDKRYDELLLKIRKHFDMADNDFNIMKERLISYIEKNKISWFKFYGMDKTFWKNHHMDFEQMKVKDMKMKNLMDYQ